MKTALIPIIGLLIISALSASSLVDRDKRIEALESQLTQQDSTCIIHSERLLRHMVVNYKLDSICDHYQSSRRAKQGNKELLTLSMGL